MKKFDNFCNCLNILKNIDKEKIQTDEIYRMGVIGQFNLCFELSWKALQAALVLHSVQDAQTGSPREIIKLGFKVGFVVDEKIWLDMLQKRNKVVHIYNEEEANLLIELIWNDYIPAFERFQNLLAEKIKVVGGD